MFVAAVTERVLGKTNTTSASAKFEESQQLTNMQLMKKLKKAVDIDKKKLQMAQEEVQAQQKSFNIFLQDQGNPSSCSLSPKMSHILQVVYLP